MLRRSTLAIGTVLGVLVVALLAVQTGAWVDVVGTGEYDRTNVTAVDANGTELATVDARVADSYRKRMVGLSNTASLGPSEGMLFVHDDEDERAFVMRKMDFPLDIVFVAENGTVTAIRHAPVPADANGEGDLQRYRGTGKYVLEVNRGWTNETGLDVGDRIRIPGETNETNRTGGTDQTNGTNDAVTSCTANGSAVSAAAVSGRPNVLAVGANGTEFGSVTVAVADNGSERYTGLSDTASLGPDEGMLFVHDEEGEYAYVMREMDFPLDIVFVAANGTVTEIHHADLPPEGTSGEELQRYPGTGKYVLEVNQGWTNETGLDVGDRLCFPANE